MIKSASSRLLVHRDPRGGRVTLGYWSELDVVVNDPAKIGQVLDVAAVLLNNGVAGPDRKAFQATFRRRPLQIRIVFVLAILGGIFRVTPKDGKSVGA